MNDEYRQNMKQSIEGLYQLLGSEGTGPVERLGQDCVMTLDVRQTVQEATLMVQATDIVQKEGQAPQHRNTLVNIPFAFLREALAKHGYGLVDLPKEQELPQDMPGLLTRLITYLLKDVRSLNDRLIKATNIAEAEHKRADENFLDLRNEIGINRAAVRGSIIRYLLHIASPENTRLDQGIRSALGQAAVWIEDEEDVKWESKDQEPVSQSH